MSTFVDMFGKEITIGSKVIYTTNTRESGLTYGRVEYMYKSDGTYKVHKVKIRPLKDDGTDLMQMEYLLRVPGDYNTRYSIETHRPVRASTIDYSAHKILVLE